MAAILCQSISSLCDRPFCPFVTVVTVINIVPAITGFVAATVSEDDKGGCRDQTWLLINACLCGTNIAAAWYLSQKIARSSPYDDPNLRDKHTASSRVAHLLCYDPWVAAYIIVLFGFFLWQSLGFTWMIADSSCSKSVRQSMLSALLFGWAFISLGTCSFICSLCCSSCDTRRYGEEQWPVTLGTSVSNGNPLLPEDRQQNSPVNPDSYQWNVPVAIAEPIPCPVDKEHPRPITVEDSKASMFRRNE